jgi:hypothetical protein
VATQTGLPGLLAILALVIYLLKIGFRPKESQVRFGLAAAFLTGFVIQGLTSSFEDARHLWFLIGLLVAGTRLEKEGLSAEFGSRA